jgi:phosphatidylserine/phosphatidylglycerophosphate/cardiolipin synthase-like enzyme
MLQAELEAVGLEVFPPAQFEFSKRKPLTVQPILTPDNYVGIVLDLIRKRPTKRLFFQNQSLNPILSPTPEWAELLQRLAEYSQDDSLDVRIIFRNIGVIRKKVESLKAAGFNMDRVRVQEGCHTKGIVIDSTTVLLGSHNWTNEGIQANRDASLLIHNPEIAGYYEAVFLHDWDHLAKPSINEEATPIPVVPGQETAEAALRDETAFRRVPWSEWQEE